MSERSEREPTAPRPGGRSGMSVSGTLSIIVAAIAVILGFLILRDINDDGNSSGGSGDKGTTQTTDSLPGGSDPATTVAPDTTQPTPKPYTILVANAARASGAAKAMTTALQGKGLTVLEGTNSTLTTAQATTTIYYVEGFQAEAQALGVIMGVTAIEPMPATPPVADLGAANVLVQLGTDLANKALPTSTTPTTAAAATDTASPPTS